MGGSKRDPRGMAPVRNGGRSVRNTIAATRLPPARGVSPAGKNNPTSRRAHKGLYDSSITERQRTPEADVCLLPPMTQNFSTEDP